MKRKLLIIFLFLCFFSFNIGVDALCYDNDLNDWATDLELEFIDFDPTLINEETGKDLGYTMNYAYILGLSKHRDDVVLKAVDDNDNQNTWMYIPGHKIWGIPSYSKLYTVHYKLSVIGGEKSACPNEIIKTFEKSVEPFNLYYKTEKCQDYPDAPLCAIYKDTSNVSEQEFKIEMEKYIIENVPPKVSFFKKIINFVMDYLIYIIIPFVLISIVYVVKINNVKRKEKNR